MSKEILLDPNEPIESSQINYYAILTALLLVFVCVILYCYKSPRKYKIDGYVNDEY